MDPLTQNNGNLFTAPDNPYALFSDWIKQAETMEPSDPNAMCLATCTKEGRPSTRMVLMKQYDERGLVFYTNDTSRKGKELRENPYVSVCFHWKSLLKQVRIEGRVEKISAAESTAYFNTRHRGSRIGAWASRQSQPLGSYEELKNFVETYEAQFEGKTDIPKPDYWNGYRIIPDYFEFWIDGEYRLHQRYLYTPDGDGGWIIRMLYP